MLFSSLRYLFISFIFFFSFAAFADAEKPAVVVAPPPPPPNIAAKSWLLIDFLSGQVIMEKNADEQVAPASLTKLMTAYVVFHELKSKHLSLSDKVRVSEKAWRMGGSKMYIKVDSEVTIEDLLKGMIIQSGNDASVALAEFVAGSEDSFASLMNQYAARLQLKQTHFDNSTGMPGPKHLTSARDMVTLATALVQDFPEYYKLYSQKEFTYNKITQQNRNLLLWRDNSVDGMKTGYTESAGYCLLASAKRDNMRLISVVMGTKSKKARASESQKMLNYGFRFYETHKVYSAGQDLSSQRVWQGASEQVSLGLAKDLYVTTPRGQYQQIQPMLNFTSTQIMAPVSAGTTYGRIRLLLGGQELVSRPLLAKQDIAEGNWWQMGVDYLLLQFE
ncbi:D-alanyl-D-alanine carboxypeptidase family protein [Candidatus Venteria ishoeyi]|nr:D-alanyl-D-alanine carboxypeptidase family protein [Candidatus Venteria ishoeyi]MDM8545935.1 D-alanyl-D-alanine carboxypeptidase family protein [Candidatus Venteria ishoeyi]